MEYASTLDTKHAHYRHRSHVFAELPAGLFSPAKKSFFAPPPSPPSTACGLLLALSPSLPPPKLQLPPQEDLLATPETIIARVYVYVFVCVCVCVCVCVPVCGNNSTFL